MTDRSDEALLADYRDSRDPAAFEALAVRYRPRLVRTARRYTRDGNAAEDVAQDALLSLHLHCDRFQPGRRVFPWIYTLATNAAIDYRRRHGRHCTSLVGDVAQSEGEPPSDPAELRRVRIAVDRLPARLRQAVQLVYYDGLDYRQAADALSVPVGTVSSRLNRARDKLRGML